MLLKISKSYLQNTTTQYAQAMTAHSYEDAATYMMWIKWYSNGSLRNEGEQALNPWKQLNDHPQEDWLKYIYKNGNIIMPELL